jgi:hypothetical protein
MKMHYFGGGDIIDIIQMKHFEGFGSIGIPVCASIDAVF